VLEGAVTTINTYKPLIQIELNGLSDTLYNISSGTIISYLDSINYKLFADRGANLFFISKNL